MTHDEAWTRLPDLLDDRDDPELLAHVQACAECQRQLFLLGRVDRLLRDRATSLGGQRTRPRRRTIAVGVAAAVAVLAGTLALLLAQSTPAHTMAFHDVAGKMVGQAVMGHSDARNVSLALHAQDLPVDHGRVYVLWAGDDARTSMQVGRFMVDQLGGCRVRFNLPADHTWGHFWITRLGSPSAIVAET